MLVQLQSFGDCNYICVRFDVFVCCLICSAAVKGNGQEQRGRQLTALSIVPPTSGNVSTTSHFASCNILSQIGPFNILPLILAIII